MTPTTHAPTDSQRWQALVGTLERAATACHARGDSTDFALEAQISWLQHCLLIEDAAEAIRAALPFELADTNLDMPGGLTPLSFHVLPADSTSAAPHDGEKGTANAAPLALMEEAWQEFDHLQGDSYWLGNVPLLLAGFEVADALAAVRTHYE